MWNEEKKHNNNKGFLSKLFRVTILCCRDPEEQQRKKRGDYDGVKGAKTRATEQKAFHRIWTITQGHYFAERAVAEPSRGKLLFISGY